MKGKKVKAEEEADGATNRGNLGRKMKREIKRMRPLEHTQTKAKTAAEITTPTRLSLYVTPSHEERSSSNNNSSTSKPRPRPPKTPLPPVSAKQLIPLKTTVEEGWLYASSEEIREWYDAGKKECEAHMANNKFSTEYTEPYTDVSRLDFGGQGKCRGVDMFYGITGMLVWPFGPKNECPTYKKCWIGLLTCGTPKEDNIRKIGADQILKQFQKMVSADKSESSKKRAAAANALPTFTGWSIRALYMYMRVIGNEIVVPTQRYYTLKDSNRNNVDVIIAQYTLTVPGSTLLEIRHHELHHAALYDWSPQQIDEYGMTTAANVFLGGIEERCKPFTKCTHKNWCCGCDEKSFVVGTPLPLNVPNGEDKCPGLKSTPLPLCAHKLV